MRQKKRTQKIEIRIYFSDVFGVSPDDIENYGAFNVSLISDLPLFIDPFLIFNSDKPEYQKLHQQIVRYVLFLKERSKGAGVNDGLLKSWFYFPEVEQTWLGFSKQGNAGRGLGRKFGQALHKGLKSFISDFGQETITNGSHLEKLCLIKDGVGRDCISDFTTNLIKEYLLQYTERFAIEHVAQNRRKKLPVTKVRFNYTTETWEKGVYELPVHNGDYVILVPRDLLTKDESWISRRDLSNRFHDIVDAVPNEQLRSQIDNYFRRLMPDDAKKKEVQKAITKVIEKYPELIDYYINIKEQAGDQAVSESAEKVKYTKQLFIEQLTDFVELLSTKTDFYKKRGNSYTDALSRVRYLKDVIENKDGYRLFHVKGKPIQRESDLQILFRLTWFAAMSDVSPETNAGRGPVDFKISRGANDKTLVEFKLAKNKHLERNLEKQVKIYEKAHDTRQSLKVILYFSDAERGSVEKILKSLKLEKDKSIILIDGRADNKPSASKA